MSGRDSNPPFEVGGAERDSIRSAASEMQIQIVQATEQMVLDMLPRRPPPGILAAGAKVSLSELNWAFRIARGAPLYTALLWLRLDEADRLLREEAGLPPEAAALRCGFGHYGVFHRSYRRRFGREPGEHADKPEPSKENGANREP